METIREFAPADRYTYDFGACTSSRGWAQIDTDQDASYFGTWANPIKLWIFNYCEGDTTLHRAATPEEFVKEIRAIDDWNRKQGYKPVKIDGMCKADIIKAFQDLGLENMLH